MNSIRCRSHHFRALCARHGARHSEEENQILPISKHLASLKMIPNVCAWPLAIAAPMKRHVVVNTETVQVRLRPNLTGFLVEPAKLLPLWWVAASDPKNFVPTASDQSQMVIKRREPDLNPSRQASAEAARHAPCPRSVGLAARHGPLCPAQLQRESSPDGRCLCCPKS